MVKRTGLEAWTRDFAHIFGWFTWVAQEKLITHRDFMCSTCGNAKLGDGVIIAVSHVKSIGGYTYKQYDRLIIRIAFHRFKRHTTVPGAQYKWFIVEI